MRSTRVGAEPSPMRGRGRADAGPVAVAGARRGLRAASLPDAGRAQGAAR